MEQKTQRILLYSALGIIFLLLLSTGLYFAFTAQNQNQEDIQEIEGRGTTAESPENNENNTTEEGTHTEENDYMTFESSHLGFKINYPEKWTYEEAEEDVEFTGGEGTKIYLFLVRVKQAEEAKTLDEYVQEIEEGAKQSQEIKIGLSESTQLGGVEAHKLTLVENSEEPDPTKTLTTIITLKNNKVYYLSYSSLNPEDSGEETFKKVLESFKFL